jgi:hypothetical protein
VSSTNGSLEWGDTDGGPLAARLRALEWPEASTEVRERCWRRIRERLAELEAGNGSGEATLVRIDRFERHGFSRKAVSRRLTPVEGWARRDRRLGPVHLSTSTGARVQSMLRAGGARAA